MASTTENTYSNKRSLFPLPARISLGLVLAAIVPLAVIFFFTIFVTRPALIEQANKAMASDAQTRVQVINNYLKERIGDAQTLAQVPSIQSFLLLPPPPETPIPTYRDAATHAKYGLGAGVFKNKDYQLWALFDKTGNLRLSYPLDPQKHGQSYVSQDLLGQVNAGKSVISPVYYGPDTKDRLQKKATVDIYSPITNGQPEAQNVQPTIIGFIRSTLTLDYIWNEIVQKDLENNGAGSYAFIVDENGVRIADTQAKRRFTSVAKLPQDVQQQIDQEKRFNGSGTLSVLEDNNVVSSLRQQSSVSTFQAQPAGERDSFQIVRQSTDKEVVPWNYFVLSPVNTVTSLANQQTLLLIISAFAFSLIVAIGGVLAGRGLTKPILRAVESLRSSSSALTDLATNQQEAATEQRWVVDSSQVGMKAVQYYTDASKMALQQLSEGSVELARHWRQIDPRQVDKALERDLSTIKYLANATEYQSTSNQKLSTALKVATQVTDQLHQGATSATEAAAQLELVVKELRSVVGR